MNHPLKIRYFYPIILQKDKRDFGRKKRILMKGKYKVSSNINFDSVKWKQRAEEEFVFLRHLKRYTIPR